MLIYDANTPSHHEEKIFNGTVINQINDCLSFFEKNILREKFDKSIDSKRTHTVANFPLIAFKEALVNAVYHRSYEPVYEIPVIVRVTPN
jgi:ATP-dependent DNA helicase RecG